MDGSGEGLRYGYYGRMGTAVFIPTVAMVILGLLNVVMGFETAVLATDIYVDTDSYVVVRFVFAAVAMTLSVMAFRQRMITEGMLLMMGGLSAIVVSVTEYTEFTISDSMIYVFMAFGYATCTAIFASRKQWVYGTATALFSVGGAVSAFAMDFDVWICAAIAMFLSGVVVAVAGCVAMVRIGFLHDPPPVSGRGTGMSDHEYSHMLISTAGIMSFTFLSLVLSYAVIGHGHESLETGLTKIVLSVAVGAFGMYALKKGVVSEGIMMLCVAVLSATPAAVEMLGLEPVEILGMMMSFIFLALAVGFTIQRNHLMTVTALLLFVLFLGEFFVHEAKWLEVLISVMKVIAGYYAVAKWMEYDLGRSVLPTGFRRNAE